MNLQRKKSICVYCAHRDGAKPSYLQAAQDTGEMIARHNMRLVYGAGSVGLMGKVANSAQSGNLCELMIFSNRYPDIWICGKSGFPVFRISKNPEFHAERIQFVWSPLSVSALHSHCL